MRMLRIHHTEMGKTFGCHPLVEVLCLSLQVEVPWCFERESIDSALMDRIHRRLHRQKQHCCFQKFGEYVE